MEVELDDVPYLFYRLISARRYRDALQFVQQEPVALLAITYASSNRITLLHAVCTHLHGGDAGEDDAVVLAEAMLRKRPDLASTVMARDGLTPLHLSVYPFTSNGTPIPRSTKLALLLLRLGPQSVNIVERHGWSPFLIACWAGVDIVVLKAMLEINPSLASQLAHQSTEILEDTPLCFLTMSRQYSENRNENERHKAILILKTVFHRRLVDDKSTKFLAHAFCSYLYPLEFVNVFVKNCGAEIQAQLSQRDDEGNHPLHYAVQSVFVKNWEGKEQRDMDLEKRHWAKLVGALVVRAQPRAALVPDRMGRLPLFLALQCTGMSWNRELIVSLAHECPQTLYRRDESPMLYPALFAATRAEDSNEHLSVAYELLRETPEFFLHVQPTAR